MATFDSHKLPTARLRDGYLRADLELHGVDQAVPSYEGRVFVNRPDADAHTGTGEGSGYLGSFFVFGKVSCWGEDEGHCEQPDDRSFDRRRSPGRYVKVRVRTPDGLLARLAAEAGEEITLNIVVVVPESEEYARYEPHDLLRFERLAIVTYA